MATERLGHDAAAFTQGLEFHEGRLYESRGRFGTSGLSEIDAETGEVLRWAPLDDDEFGEGLTVVDDRIIVLTWRNEVAYVYDIETLQVVESFRYSGEGWGLCHDGAALWMSNGTDVLTRRDAATFEELGTVAVTYQGNPVSSLNELECIGDRVYANVWKQDAIAVIDPSGGVVRTVIDARGLLSAEDLESMDRSDAVLNGIAYDDTTDRLVLTGKLWPAMFAVELVE